MARMLGRHGQPFCGSKCCGEKRAGKRHTRRMKRRERQEWKTNARKAEEQ